MRLSSPVWAAIGGSSSGSLRGRGQSPFPRRTPFSQPFGSASRGVDPRHPRRHGVSADHRVGDARGIERGDRPLQSFLDHRHRLLHTVEHIEAERHNARPRHRHHVVAWVGGHAKSLPHRTPEYALGRYVRIVVWRGRLAVVAGAGDLDPVETAACAGLPPRR